MSDDSDDEQTELLIAGYITELKLDKSLSIPADIASLVQKYYEIIPIVIGNGSFMMKAGFAGKDAPQYIFPTVIGTPRYFW